MCLVSLIQLAGAIRYQNTHTADYMATERLTARALIDLTVFTNSISDLKYSTHHTNKQ